MSMPWEDYAAPANPPAGGQSGPWEDFASPTAASEVPLTPGRPRITVTPVGAPQQPPAAPQQPAGDMGQFDALVRSALQGATANFGDEMQGVSAAGGGGPMGSLIGLARLGYEALAGRGQATQAYEQGRDQFRGEVAQGKEQFPWTSLAGEVAGAIALPGGALMRGATMPARMASSAAVGAGYGGLSGAGAGENLEDRAIRGGTGTAVGGVLGAAAPPLLSGIEAAGRGIAALSRPATSTMRGVFRPDDEAARRVVTGLTRDMQTGSGGMTPQQFTNARNAGAPVAIADMGGEATRAIARSAANTSPEARTALTNLADERFEGQADRATNFIRRMVGNTDTHETREALEAAARAANRPAYDRAYRSTNAQVMWDEGFEQLMQSPAFQAAARDATRIGANRAAYEGFTPVRNPFQWDEAGRWTLAGEARPNLQFWDFVKRALDRQVETLRSNGAWSEVRDVTQLRRALVNHLDELVPYYQVARAGAARFLGADTALGAGENFVSRLTAAEGARIVAQMSGPERELFRLGFAARYIDDINRTRDRINVIGKLGASNEARAKLNVALGPQGAQRLNAFLTVEQAMDRLRTALGNSTTVRQWMEAGLAGGTLGYGQLTGDPYAIGNAALVYGLLRGQRGIDQRVARRVAEMLTSNDPQVLARGIRAAASNQRILEAFRRIDSRLAQTGGQQGQNTPALQALGVGRSEEE